MYACVWHSSSISTRPYDLAMIHNLSTSLKVLLLLLMMLWVLYSLQSLTHRAKTWIAYYLFFFNELLTVMGLEMLNYSFFFYSLHIYIFFHSTHWTVLRFCQSRAAALNTHIEGSLTEHAITRQFLQDRVKTIVTAPFPPRTGNLPCTITTPLPFVAISIE